MHICGQLSFVFVFRFLGLARDSVIRQSCLLWNEHKRDKQFGPLWSRLLDGKSK